MSSARGFSLLECLFVLFVVAVISILGIHRYRAYRQHMQVALIKKDITTIQSALNAYYHKMLGSSSGAFPDDKDARHPSLEKLALNMPGRPPQIPLSKTAYTVEIKKVGVTPVVVNQLIVSAHFSSHYSAKRLAWYVKALNAKRENKATLTWITLPGSTASATGGHLWVMKAQTEQFRRMENTLMKREQK